MIFVVFVEFCMFCEGVSIVPADGSDEQDASVVVVITSRAVEMNVLFDCMLDELKKY